MAEFIFKTIIIEIIKLDIYKYTVFFNYSSLGSFVNDAISDD